MSREISLARPARRVVSLVPSETHALIALGAAERLVGRTDYCLPAGDVAALPSVGGTKNPDVELLLSLKPDLVLANQEENGRKAVEAIIAAGMTVHVSFPKTVNDALSYLVSLAALLEVELSDEYASRFERWSTRPREPVRVFVPIWDEPLMTFNEAAYASDVLALVGGTNVFGDRARRYPLGADLGKRGAVDPKSRDTRYPRVTRDEVRDRRPELILLPDEPFAFTEDHAKRFEDELGVRARLCSGKPLFWYGTWDYSPLASLLTR